MQIQTSKVYDFFYFVNLSLKFVDLHFSALFRCGYRDNHMIFVSIISTFLLPKTIEDKIE